MEENLLAKIIKIIAIIILILGIIGSLIMGKEFETTINIGYTTIHHYNTPIAIVGICSSILFCILFYTLAEIITLLQNNYNKNSEINNKINTIQETIIEEIRNKNKPSEYVTSLDEIEANLPKI